MTVSLQVAARAYAESGWAVFPLRPRDKKPLAKTNGFYDATTDTKQVEQWWAAKPACNIGIRTGEASSICVIDIDGEEGESEWRAILGDNPEPGTLTNKTGSGGRHLIFQHPGTKIGNQNLSAKINVRADGGYIVAPPSIHPSGKAYEWANPDAKIEPLPDWLLDALNARGNKPERAAPPSDDLVAIIAPPIPSATKATIRYGEEALTREINAVRTAPNGDRNNQLNKSTFALSQLAASGVLDAYTVADQLLAAAVANGLAEGEARRTIASGLKAGIRQPRDLSHVGQRQSQWDAIAPMDAPGDYEPTNDAGQGGAVQVKATPQPAQRPAREPKQPTPLAIVAGDELYDREYPPRQFIVDGLIKRGDCVLLAGRPKSGKSWLLLQLAQHIDTGLPFIGKTTTKASVLYLALEDGDRRIHERQHIRKWKPKQAAFGFGIMPLPGDGLAQLQAAADPFEVIVIDTLRAACGGEVDENDNAQMGAIMQDLANFAHRSQKTVIVTHHTRKGESEDTFDLIRGAGAIRAAYDVGLVIQRKTKEAEAVLHVESRDVEADDMTLRFDGATGWSYEGNAGQIEVIRAGRGVVKALVSFDRPAKTEEIAEMLNISKEAARVQLIAAQGQGLVLRSQVQGAEKTKPYDVWTLSPKGQQVASQK